MTLKSSVDLWITALLNLLNCPTWSPLAVEGAVEGGKSQIGMVGVGGVGVGCWRDTAGSLHCPRRSLNRSENSYNNLSKACSWQRTVWDKELPGSVNGYLNNVVAAMNRHTFGLVLFHILRVRGAESLICVRKTYSLSRVRRKKWNKIQTWHWHWEELTNNIWQRSTWWEIVKQQDVLKWQGQ